MSLYKGNNLISGAMPNSANQSLSNLDSAGQDKFDAKVNKSGDTMTGDLNISGDNNVNIRLSNTGIVKGTIPSTQTWQGVHFNDSTNDANWDNTRIGVIESSVDTSGNTHVNVLATPNVIGSTTQDGFRVQMTSSGVASCSFPNTTCVDGQWENFFQNIIQTAVSVNGNTDLPYTVTVPNDGHVYEYIIQADGNTGKVTGNWFIAMVKSNVISDYIWICGTATQGNRIAGSQGSAIIPIKYGTNNLYLRRNSNYNGTVRLQAVARRRLGTNS